MTRATRASVPARAHLAGNPSDGYRGAVLGTSIAALSATVTVTDADSLQIPDDAGGLVSATHGALVDGSAIDARPIRIEWSTTIPRSVGLAGSSAIVLATTRALIAHLDGTPPSDEAELALAVERDHLGIAAGIADRHVQACGGVVHSDARPDQAVARPIAEHLPGPVLLAWNPAAAAPSGEYHGHLRARFAAGDRDLIDHMAALAALADDAARAVRGGDHRALAAAADASLERRCALGGVAPATLEPVAALRTSGCGVNFAGSGGCVVAVAESGVLQAAAAALPPGWIPLLVRR